MVRCESWSDVQLAARSFPEMVPVALTVQVPARGAASIGAVADRNRRDIMRLLLMVMTGASLLILNVFLR